MGKFAIIKANVVELIAIADAPLNVDGLWINVTEISPEPGRGWKYIDGVFSPPDPTISPPKTYTRLQLIDIFDSDYNNILTTSKTDVEVEVWLEKFRLKNLFVVTDNTFINDINFLVTKNLINQTKADSILI